MMRPSCSELVEAGRRTSTESTGSEKIRYEKAKINHHSGGKNRSEGDKNLSEGSEGYGSLAL